MELKTITHGSKEYKQMVDLRFEVLRKPLGLTFSQEHLQSEKNLLLLGLFEDENILACCLLREEEEKEVQLHQMAVEPTRQGSGLGQQILTFAEQVARQHNYLKLYMHARKHAVGFYAKQGYSIVGEEFEEVSIPHVRMEKQL